METLILLTGVGVSVAWPDMPEEPGEGEDPPEEPIHTHMIMDGMMSKWLITRGFKGDD